MEANEGSYLKFGEALEEARVGKRICRAGWNGRGMWIELQNPDTHSKMGRPYLYMKGVDGLLFPWNPNQIDMLACDWQIAA